MTREADERGTRAPQLFRYQTSLVAVGTGEPCVVLIENDTAFSVLFAESTHEETVTGQLLLNGAWLLRVKDKDWTYRGFRKVILRRSDEGLWVAEDDATRLVFHEPSEVPYHVVFISWEDFTRLCSWREQDVALPVFEFAQELFGALPGFSCADKLLTTPDGYANAGQRLTRARFLCWK